MYKTSFLPVTAVYKSVFLFGDYIPPVLLMAGYFFLNTLNAIIFAASIRIYYKEYHATEKREEGL